ncbi:prephenate dehydratase [Fodinisporobacter ferrooxydans]|uniref:Prephenate dehydratase n=1 Tax=Fodinisporobacter ferrooxydans TaxID=2901836 RepID=A0ABY4CHQ5_9BACL|nr:prephenate dehydratase [Alicyclobacillaceae bacterium MYW30-H2]
MKKVGYLGPAGTFSEQAASRYTSNEYVELLPFQTIVDVLDGLDSGMIDKGVVQIENTIDGSINLTLDRITQSADLFVQGEITLSITQCLLGIPGAKISDIREVWSIPPAIAQCRSFIKKIGATVKHFESTASAAEEAKKSGRTDVGAVASAWAANRIGLQILADQIQDTAVNHTRFVVVTKGKEPLDFPDKTMLLIIPCQEYKGALANILNIFSVLNLNLTWIESRPTKTRLGTYQFYLDVEAGETDECMSKALSILGMLGHKIRVLGIYKASKPV